MWKRDVPRPVGCAVVCVLIAAAWLVFEIEAQRSVLAGPTAVYRDPDHRLAPHDPRARTNGDGLRCALEAADITDDACTVLFAGDSFVFGVQVEPHEALPQRLQARLRERLGSDAIHVVNAGWESASPLLALRLLVDIGRKYRPDVVLYGFDMTDFRDDLMYRNLIGGKRLYSIAGVAPATLWLANRAARRALPEGAYQLLFGMPSDRFFAVNRPLSQSRELMMPAWRTIREMHEFSSRELGAEFVLVVLPRNFQYSDRESPASWELGQYRNLGPFVHEPFRFFEEQAMTAEFAVYSLLPAFERTTVFPTCFTGDPHWTPAGTAVAAEALAELCLRDGWLNGCGGG